MMNSSLTRKGFDDVTSGHRGPTFFLADGGNRWTFVSCLAQSPFRSALAGVVPEDYLGMVVAVVELVDCKPIVPGNLPPEPDLSFGDYRAGRFMWALRDVRRLVEPVADRGKQGLWSWEVPESVQLCREAGK